MQIDKRNRSDLKKWFVKNAIPTESNFAELIDGMLNQKDDGIAKLPNDALSIEAAGDPTSQKKAIHFYNSFADTDPTWVLSLNPRQNPADAATAKAGFSISDSAGTSRLFIDRTTGRLGVGTLVPQAALHIDRGGTNDIALMLSSSGPGWGSGLQLKNTSPGAVKAFGIYADSSGALLFTDVNASLDRMLISKEGNVGIGTTTPLSTLTVGGPNASLRIASGNENGYVFDNDNADGYKLKLRYKNPTSVFSEIATFDYANGGVGIGTAPGGHRFNVSAKSIKLGLEQDGGGQLIITHDPNDNRIYLEAFSSDGQDSAAALYLTGKNAGPVSQLNLVANSTNITARLIKLGLEGNGGGQMILTNNSNDNRIYMEAFSSDGQGHATELLLTGKNGQPVPELSLIGTTINLRGQVRLANSDIYFLNTEHNHTGIGNEAGRAAIENAKNYDALMILGRAGTPEGRKVRLWDYLKVEGTLANLSDATTKQDIASLEYGLAEVKRLRPIAFNWIDRPNPHKSLGLIGQEVREVIHEVVYDDDGEVSISYLSLVPVLINAIKELDRKLEALSPANEGT